MRELRRHIGDEPAELGVPNSRRQAFLLTRHYIGRLGSHLKAAKILTTVGWRMPNLLENFTIQTRPSPPSSLPLPVDQQMTLNGIINRMIGNDREKTLRYQKDLAIMDTKFHILDRFRPNSKTKTSSRESTLNSFCWSTFTNIGCHLWKKTDLLLVASPLATAAITISASILEALYTPHPMELGISIGEPQILLTRQTCERRITSGMS